MTLDATTITREIRLTEYPHASRVLVHLSDVHLRDFGSQLYEHIDSTQRLIDSLAKLESMEVHPDALVFTGDLADFAEDGAYRNLRALVDAAAARMDTRTIWVMGNHDDRTLFKKRMLDEHPDPESTLDEPADAVYDVAGLRVISLDSTVPGNHYGQVTDAQLEWLAATLATPAEHGTVLAMHHPPIPMINDATVAVELQDQAALAEVLRGTDVRTILAGHLHYSTHATFAGIPVSVASATCYTQDLAVPRHTLRPRDGSQSFNLVHVYDSTIVHTIVPVELGVEMEYQSADETHAMLTEWGIQVRRNS